MAINEFILDDDTAYAPDYPLSRVDPDTNDGMWRLGAQTIEEFFAPGSSFWDDNLEPGKHSEGTMGEGGASDLAKTTAPAGSSSPIVLIKKNEVAITPQGQGPASPSMYARGHTTRSTEGAQSMREDMEEPTLHHHRGVVPIPYKGAPTLKRKAAAEESKDESAEQPNKVAKWMAELKEFKEERGEKVPKAPRQQPEREAKK